MRVVHLSDTHLGHQQFARTDPRTGLNQREQDHYDAFTAIIDFCLEAKPDLVIHSGDVFDGVRPSNRALGVALDGFVRLDQAGIPTVVIAGNHEHPKMLETGSPMRLLDHLAHVHAVYKGRREDIEVAGTVVHAVPQCPDNQALRKEMADIEGGILVIHGGVMGMDAFHHAEFNELTLDPAWFTGGNETRFDYVALGHYHGVTEITPRAWYAGAPDRVSIREAGEEKGFLEIDITDGTHVSFRPLPVRPYADLPVLDVHGLDADAVLQAATAALAQVPEGAVCRLRIDGASPSLRGSLDTQAIRQAGRHLLDLDVPVRFEDDGHHADTGIALGTLAEEFDAFAATYPLEDLDRQELLGRARDVLHEAA